MKNTTKRFFAVLLSTLMVGSVTACMENNPPANMGESDTVNSTENNTHSPSLETQTENGGEAGAETMPLPTDFIVTEQDGTASVTTPMGLSYTVTGYTSLDKGVATFSREMLYTFPEGFIDEPYNRFTMTYSADQPLKVWVKYASAKEEDVFYVEAGNGDFSALIPNFLSKEYHQEFSSIRVEPCVAGTASFSLIGLSTEARAVPDSSTYVIENEAFKVGVALHWGGGINYFEDKTDGDSQLSNLINQHDTGRLLQQSYYGVSENEEYIPGYYGETKWCYNPVQGGNVEGNASRIIDFVVTENSVYIKAQPRDWAVGVSIAPAYMENTYTLYTDRVRVDNRFVDFSGWTHRYCSQELPAFYTISYLDCFSLYNGVKPWTDDVMSYRDDLNFWGDAAYHSDGSFALKESNTETWCAWTNTEADYGVGLYVPNVDGFLAGRFLHDGTKSADENPCNYVAPLKTIMLTAFEPLEYSYMLTVGSLDEIRAIFKENKDFTTNEALNKNSQSGRASDSSTAYNEYKYGETIEAADPISPNLNLTKESNCKHVTPSSRTEVSFDAEIGAVKLSVLGEDPHVTISYADILSADTYKTLEITYMIPAGSQTQRVADLFFCAGDVAYPTGDAMTRVSVTADGEYHTLVLDLSDKTFWNGLIHSIRFDYFDGCQVGEVMYVTSIVLK